jgi:C1A family cysteine protease
MDNAFNYVAKNDEFSETAYPYHAKDESCKAAQHKPTEAHVRDTGINKVGATTAALEKALTLAPVSVAVDASNWSSYKSGVFSNCKTGLNHGVLAVGYTS